MVRALEHIVRDSRGNVLPMAAVGILMMAALVGGGVDLSRAYKVQNRLQAACDAGVLAGRKAVANNGFDSTAEDEANSYFNANFDDDIQGTSETAFTPDSDDNGNSVTATATTSMATTIMRIFGEQEVELSVTCNASMGVGNSDITMVLDTTGSMAWDLDSTNTRIEALRTAMMSFYDTVDESTSSSNARIRYSIVPYSSSVNVGALLVEQDPSYLVDSYTYQSRQWVTETRQDRTITGWTTVSTDEDVYYEDDGASSWSQYSGTRYRSLTSCRAALPASSAWSNYSSSSTNTDTTTNSNGQRVTVTSVEQPQRQTVYTCSGGGTTYRIYNQYLYRLRYTDTTVTQDPVYTLGPPYTVSAWQYKPVTFNTSQFKTFAATTTPTGNSGANQTSTWNGCILERATVADDSFSFSAGSGISPSGAWDLDIDEAPDSNDTRWAPMWNQITYARGVMSGSRLSWRDASPQSAGQLVSGACPAEAILLREMDRDFFEDQTNLLIPTGSTYHDIGMIWGGRLSSPNGIFADVVNEEPDNGATVSRHLIFMTDGEMAPSTTTLSAYGVEYYDKRITGNGSSSDLTNRHNARFLAVCEAVKAKGIRVWVIAMATGLTTELSTCASPNSAFTAADSAALNTAFEEIANQVGELRVTQ